MSTITEMIEARIKKQAEEDVVFLKRRMKELYKDAFNISWTDDFTRIVDKDIEVMVDTLIAPKLLPHKIELYRNKFFSEMDNATKILTRFIGDQP